MKILLITRCGCQRWLEINEKYPPPIYKILLEPVWSLKWSEMYDDKEPAPIDVRTFQYRDTSRYGNFHVYLEKA